jgi:hypothetical protein
MPAERDLAFAPAGDAFCASAISLRVVGGSGNVIWPGVASRDSSSLDCVTFADFPVPITT